MDPATLNATTVSLQEGLNVVAGMLSPVGSTLVFTPSSPLLGNTLYTIAITTGARDLAGNTLDMPYHGDFTTGATPDTTPPTVVAQTMIARVAHGQALAATSR